VVNYGITTLTLAWMWEVYGPKVKNIKLNVTESGNGTDSLNETRWNVERMLKMQDEDGGARHKQTSERFPGFVMPDDDHLPSEVIGTEPESLERCGCELPGWNYRVANCWRRTRRLWKARRMIFITCWERNTFSLS
jgi:hypothetical protein